MIRILAALLFVTALPAAAFAAKLDGNALQARCSTGDVKGCEVYLQGFNAALAEFPDSTRQACLPEGVTGSQMRDVLLKFLRNEPQVRQRRAGDLIMHAFSKAWPCHG
jgi:hypothetical protein